jgi:hypothetical protein
MQQQNRQIGNGPQGERTRAARFARPTCSNDAALEIAIYF